MRAPSRSLTILPILCAVGAGLTAIYLSSAFAQHFPLREGPLPFRYPAAAIAAFLATGAFAMIAVIVRSDLFWPLLVATAATTGGMFVLGFPIFDEWLAGCLACGAAVAVVRGAVRRRREGPDRWWVWLFIALCAYLMAEGIRGLALYHNLKAMRPFLDAAIMLVIGVLFARYEFPSLSGRRVTTLLAASGAAYLALYLLHGFVFEKLVYGRNLLEGIGGAERAYATFPIAVTIPAAILLLRFERGWHWLLGLCAIVLAVDVSVLSGSRAAILTILTFFILASVRGGLRLTAQLWLSAVFAYAFVMVAFQTDPMFLWYRVESIMNGVHVTSGSVDMVMFRGRRRGKEAVVARGDANRHILNQAAVSALESDPRLFAIGAGAYGYWPSAGRFVRNLKAQHGVPDLVVNRATMLGPGPAEPPRPPAWPVFIAETGMVGVFLILGNALAGLRQTLFRRPPPDWRGALRLTPVMLAASLLALLAWGYFAEVQTKILLYLMLMPYGVVYAWSALEGAAARRPETAEEIRVPEAAAVS